MTKPTSKMRTTIAALGAAAALNSGCVMYPVQPRPVMIERPAGPNVVVVQPQPTYVVAPAPVLFFPFDIFLRGGGHGDFRDWRR